jgi:hypothetical protein
MELISNVYITLHCFPVNSFILVMIRIRHNNNNFFLKLSSLCLGYTSECSSLRFLNDSKTIKLKGFTIICFHIIFSFRIVLYFCVHDLHAGLYITLLIIIFGRIINLKVKSLHPNVSIFPVLSYLGR